MAQLFNRLRAEERIGGVEFWHSPERCGWLTKQGTTCAVIVGLSVLLVSLTPFPLGLVQEKRRRLLLRHLARGEKTEIYFAMESKEAASDESGRTGSFFRLELLLTHALLFSFLFDHLGEYIKTWRRRWFILKQGKIFWFKTESVGPVRFAYSSIPYLF